jgi:Fic family protein
MEDVVNSVNRYWENADPVALAAFALWRLNHIHPFINGNGRTARAACYFILCVKIGGWLPGKVILPDLIHRDRDEYVEALKQVDESVKHGMLDVKPLHEFLSIRLEEQINSAPTANPPMSS